MAELGALAVRPCRPDDHDAVWRILEPMIRAGETYPLPRDMSRTDALAHWTGGDHQTFVVESDGAVVGTYYLRANQGGGGAHVANAGYVTAPGWAGRGIASLMRAFAGRSP